VTPLLNKYVRQSCEREAAEQKHNHAEDCVRIFHRDICAVARLGAFGRIEGFFVVQLFDFSFVLARIVHLPVPSENLSRRGKKISESLAPTTGGTIALMGPGAEDSAKIK
jgi:hypothetical protein